MGVRGLTRYIKQCRLFKKYRVHDTTLLIDGQNFLNSFLHNLRRRWDCRLHYGCDYDTYFQALENFFNKLRQCNIEPVVIFVGSTGVQTEVFERVKERNQERINKLQFFIENDYKCQDNEPPRAILAELTFVRCLDYLRIKHMMIDYEEDNQVVALANKWGCPIMTSDTDYFLQYMPNSYVIPIWSLDNELRICRDRGISYLQMTTFQSSDLAEMHGLDPRHLPLFAAIIIEKDKNDNFMSNNIPMQSQKRDNDLRLLFNEIGRMTSSKSMEDILQHCDEYFFEDEDDDELKDRILQNYEEYSPTQLRIEYESYFDEKEELRVYRSGIRTKTDLVLPEWFIRAFRASAASRYFVNVLQCRRTTLYTQLEDLHSPSPNVGTVDIRRVLWSILLQYDNDAEGTVCEYFRENMTVIERANTPMNIVQGRSVPDLDTVARLSPNDRLDFLLLVIETSVEVLQTLPESCRFFVVVTKYWVQHYGPNPTFVYTVILAYIKLGLDESSSVSGRLAASLGWRVSPSDVRKAKTELKCMDIFFSVENSPERIKIHHVFSQWTIVYSEVYRLNELLMKPLNEVGPEQCFRGSFLYGAECYLEKCAEPLAEVQRVLGNAYSSVFCRLLTAVMPSGR